MSLIQAAKENPQTSKLGVGLLAVAGLNLAYVVAVSFINHTAPDAQALFQDCSIIVGFAVAGIIGLAAKDGNKIIKGPAGAIVDFIASHIPESVQAQLTEEGTKILGEYIEQGVSALQAQATPAKK